MTAQLVGSNEPLQYDRMSQLDELLLAARQGDRSSVDKLLALTYDDLHELARSRLRRSAKITVLDTTALVHECYLRLSRLQKLDAESQSHFFGYAAHVMRSIVVDLVRKRAADRRQGSGQEVTLNTDVADPAQSEQADILRVHEALEELALIDARLVQVVEMRYFVGLTEAQIALALGVTERTVRRDWQKARLLLHVALR